METCRAGFGPPPAWRALPKMVSSTCSGWIPARSIAALPATAPRSAAVSEASDPPNLPIGVRTAERMYTACKMSPPKHLSLAGWGKMRRQGRDLALVHLVAGVGAGRPYVFQAAHERGDRGGFLVDAQQPQTFLTAVAAHLHFSFPAH